MFKWLEEDNVLDVKNESPAKYGACFTTTVLFEHWIYFDVQWCVGANIEWDLETVVDVTAAKWRNGGKVEAVRQVSKQSAAATKTPDAKLLLRNF